MDQPGTMKNGKQIAIGICLTIGLILSIPTFFVIKDRIEFLNTSLPAEGKVVDMKRFRAGVLNPKDFNRVGADPELEKPIISFTTKQGKVITFAGGVASNVNPYSLGETVTIYYNPRNPSEAQIRSFLALWGAPLALLIITFPWFFAAGFVYFKG